MIRLTQSLIVLSVILGLAACSSGPQQAPKTVSTEGFGGTWVMSLGTRTFIVLALDKSGDAFTGTLSRPERFETGNGVRFSNFSSEVTNENVVSASLQNDKLHFVTKASGDDQDQREYDMALVGQDMAYIKLTDTPIEPWPFTRVRDANPRVVFTDWEPRRSYSVDDNAPSNPEMQRLYESDQRVRKDLAQFSKEAEAPAPGDVERRDQTRKLVMDGSLRTGEDYTRAAVIFQHGTTPDDFLLAHSLAMVGAAKGDEEALWVASATLDRYLQAIGRKQVFGTQIKERSDHTATLEPYNRELVFDTLRRELGVQPLAIQDQQLEIWTEQFKAAAAKPK
jgi:hypothetical protein